jgi:hypothetical protein
MAMAAPVINALAVRHPEWRITLRTTLSPAFVASRVTHPYTLQPAADDFGMVQRNALEVDVDASAERYRQLHHHWDAEVARVAAELLAARVDLVVADVPYLTLAAAQHAGIANVALSCLHWGDVYGHYCLDRDEGPAIHGQIMEAYGGADRFIRTEPAMPMPGLGNVTSVGPIAQRGRSCRNELTQRLALQSEERLALVSMGGIAFRLPMERWPPIPGVRFIVQHDWQIERDDCVILESLGLPFADLLASCDLLITKPGYGSFSEAAVNGTPVLYVPRNDWPESPWLVRWLEQHGHCAAIDRDRLELGELAPAIEALLARGRPVPVEPGGVSQAVEIIEALL